MKKKDILLAIGFALFLLIMFLPIWLAIVTAFTDSSASLTAGVNLWPSDFSMDGFTTLFKYNNFLRPFMVSLITTILGTLLHVLICSLGGFVLAQENLPYKKTIVTIFMFAIAVPQQILMVPQFQLFKSMGLINRYLSLVIYNMATGYSILLIMNYFKSIPKEMHESSKLDGASDWTAFYKIYLPMALPGVVTITIFDAVQRWNNYTAGLLFITDPNKMTIQQALNAIISFDDSTSGGMLVTPNVQMAAIVIGVLPLVILYFVLQKYFQKGMNAGAVKG